MLKKSASCCSAREPISCTNEPVRVQTGPPETLLSQHIFGRSVRVQEGHLAGSGCQGCAAGEGSVRSCDDVGSEVTKVNEN